MTASGRPARIPPEAQVAAIWAAEHLVYMVGHFLETNSPNSWDPERRTEAAVQEWPSFPVVGGPRMSSQLKIPI